MKRALLLLLAALAAAPAFALNPAASGSVRVRPVRTYQTHTKPYAQRVAVVFDGYYNVLIQSNVKAENARQAKLIGPTFDAWRTDGDAEVHFYTTDFFEIPADSLANGTRAQAVSYLWQRLGDEYPTVVCVGFSADSSVGKAARKRYFCADSTNAKIIHIGGGSSASSWLQNTQTFGISDTAGTGSYFDQRKAAVMSYTGAATDTLWFGLGGYGIRSGRLLPGITSVVRLFKPVALSTHFGWGNDSAFAVTPTGSDSVAGPHEVMPVAWRVYWTGTASVDFIKPSFTADYDASFGHVLTALVSRTTALRPTRAAMEWDDVFDNNPTTATRPNNAAYDSVFAEFRYTYGIPVAISTNPRHAAEYYAGDDPTREAAWEHDAGWTWIRRGIPWVHHAHDSTTSDIASNLVGRFGGYSTGNGSGSASWTTDSITATGFTRYRYGHRSASANVAGVGYSIVARLAWSDSVRRAICPTCVTPPYLSFPNNELLPTDWRAKAGTSIEASLRANYWTRWNSYQGNGTATIDSTLWAFHYGLGLASGDELFVRTTTPNNGTGTSAQNDFRGHMPPGGIAWASISGNDAPKNWTTSGDNDSVVAKTPFHWPGERMASTIAGRLVRVRNVATTSYDGGARANYTTNVQRILPALLGSRTGNLTTAGFSPWCDAHSADPGGTYTAANDQKNSGVDHARIVYLHPSANGASGWSFARGPKTSYTVEVARRGLVSGLNVLNTVAGHPLVKWVHPWEVYD